MMRNPAFALAAILLLAIGCGKKDEVVTPKPEPPITNWNGPNANERIVGQSVFGDSTLTNGIIAMEPARSGDFYFFGAVDSKRGLGLLNAAGALLWFKEMQYAARDLLPINSAAALVVVGSHDKDMDGESDEGYLSVVDAAGNLLSEIHLFNDSSDVWLNAIAQFGDTSFIAVGGWRYGGLAHPFVSVIDISEMGIAVERVNSIIASLPNVCFGNVAVDGGALNPSEDLVFYAGGAKDNTAASLQRMSLHKIVMSVHNANNYSLAWGGEIYFMASKATYAMPGSALVYYQDRLYFVGATDSDVGVPPAGGGSWTDCLVVAISSGGILNWMEIKRLSQFDDFYYCARIYKGTLYAAGIYSSYVASPPGRTLSLGLLSRFDPVSFEGESDFYIGEETNSSCLYSVCASDSIAQCGGFADSWSMQSGSRGWFVTMNPKPLEGNNARAAMDPKAFNMDGSPAYQCVPIINSR